MKSKVVFLPIAMACVIMITSACSSLTAAAQPAVPSPAPDGSPATVVEGRVEPTRYVNVALNTSGLVSEVLGKEGDDVQAGQEIARIESNQGQNLQSAQADALQAVTAGYQAVRDSQYKLDNFDEPSDFKGMTPGQAVQSSLDKLNAARDAFEPYKWMNDRQLKLTDAQENGDVLIGNTAKRMKKRLDDAWAIYRKAVEWLDDQSAVDTAEAQLAQAQKDSDALQDASFTENTAGVRAALANAELRAPFAGTITNLDLKVGEYAASGTSAVTIADLSNWVIKTTDLTEMDVINIQEGQPVTFTLNAQPGVTLKGYVQSVAQNYTTRQGDIVYKVTVRVSDKNPALRWGMTAEVKFNP